MAVQYAKAMELTVAAVDVDDVKLDLARRPGATVAVNAKKEGSTA
ncbi:D-arabinose 1-dehydrogenase-like Zn-dependent alcohol dehydrogenase [Xanthomonas campestris]|nr:D-arabinose 1-dehydrogenase-like Zn-dependent alcohol dehydrogenase [Xanthomonas euroxanthea]